jgi:Replication protein
LAVSLASINRLSSDIEVVLLEHDHIKDAVRIKGCYGYRQCQSVYCIHCASRRAYKERRHLLGSLQKLLAQNPRYQLWFITGAAADSPDVRTSACAAVLGMKKLLSHSRLKGRVIAHFSVLEVAHKHGREHPCAHVHTLAVTRPMDKGRYRISRKDWVSLWEGACPQHRKRAPTSVRRRKGAKPEEHLSLVAKLIPRDRSHMIPVIKYCTKWAATRRVTRDYRRLLRPNPQAFLDRIDALKGVPKFFGGLHRRRNEPQHPAKAEL